MTNIKLLNLPSHIERRLFQEMINTIELLAATSDDKLFQISGLRYEAILEIKYKLGQYLIENPLPHIPVFISSLGFSIRTYNALRRGGVDTVELLATMTDEDLLGIRSFGETALAEVHEKLAAWSMAHPNIDRIRSIVGRGGILNSAGKPAMPSVEEILAVLPKQQPLECLGLSVRSYRALERAGIHTVERLILMSESELLAVNNVGVGSIEEIEECMKYYFSHNTFPKEFINLVNQHKLQHEVESVAASIDEVLAFFPAQQPIDHLELPVRSYNALTRAGILTIEHLMLMTEVELLGVRNFGAKSLRDLRDRLNQYLGDHPLSEEVSELLDEYQLTGTVKSLLTFSNPHCTQQGKSRLLITEEIQESASCLPLDDIPISRLALPKQLHDALLNHQIETLGVLVLQPAEAVKQPRFIGERLCWYIDWLLTQGESVWGDEIEARGLCPIYRHMLEMISLDAVVSKWIAVLPEREQQVVCDRYGLRGIELTLEELGEQFHLTRERIRQIQKRAERKLKQTANSQGIGSLSAVLRELLAGSGGVINTQLLGESLYGALTADEFSPIGVAKLLFELDDDVDRLRGSNGWVDKRISPIEVNEIQRQFVVLLDRIGVPLTTSQLMGRFKETEFYQSRSRKLDDEVIRACLRIHPDLGLQEELWYLDKHAWKYLAGIIMALRQIGEPVHYSKIAECANALLPQDLHRTPHNIHAELGRRPDVFVRVGHGIFGLVEWGLTDDGSVANAAYRILTEAGIPLHYDVVTERVLETWKVNPGSVYAALSVDDRFVNIGSGVYWVRDQDIPGSGVDFGDLFGEKLVQRQREIEHWNNGEQLDTQDEVDLLRGLGTDFFTR